MTSVANKQRSRLYVGVADASAACVRVDFDIGSGVPLLSVQVPTGPVDDLCTQRIDWDAVVGIADAGACFSPPCCRPVVNMATLELVARAGHVQWNDGTRLRSAASAAAPPHRTDTAAWAAWTLACADRDLQLLV